MNIWHWQIAVILIGLAASMAALFRNRVLWSKLIVAAALTAIACLQLAVTPLQKKINNLEQELARLAEDDPYRPKAERDLHAALLSYDPAEAGTRQVAKLEKELADLEASAPPPQAAAVEETKKKLAAARADLEKSADPERWFARRREELDKQLKEMKPDDPGAAEIQQRLGEIRIEQAEQRGRQRSIRDYVPVNLGLDLSGGTEIRLRLRPDHAQLDIWRASLTEIERELATLAAAGSPDSADRIRELEAQKRDMEQNIAAAQETVEEEFANAVDIIRQRLNNSGLAEIPVTRQGGDQVLIQLPGMDSGRTRQIMRTIQRQGRLEFRMVEEEKTNKKDYDIVREYVRADAKRQDADLRDFCTIHEQELAPLDIERQNPGRPGERWICKVHRNVLYDYLRTPDERKRGGEVRHGESFLVRKMIELTGDQIIRATAEPNFEQAGSFQISVTLNAGGGAVMERVTSENEGGLLGIVLDGKLASAPRIQSRFGSRFRITGDFDQEEAEQLEVVLKSGSLKVVPEVEFENTVGPTLGEDSIRRGIESMIVGFLVVVGFMLFYYLVAGLVTDAVLFVNLIFIVAILSSFDATLTLPGIAGLILTVGMAVDANVLIFERIREERDKGNSLARSIQIGYERAFVTILDANITTLITAVILHSFGTEAVRGFAVTLIIGILTSMFCALVLSRWIFETLLEYRVIEDLKMLLFFKRPAVDFLRLRRPAMILSGICIAVGVAAVAWRGERNLGPDFRGGTIAQVALSEPISMEEARGLARNMAGFADVAENMQSFGTGIDGKFDEFVLRASATRPDSGPPEPAEAAPPGNQPEPAEVAKKDPFRLAIEAAFPTLQPEGIVPGARLPERSTPLAEVYAVDLTLRTALSPQRVRQILGAQTELVEPVAVKRGDPLPELPKSDKAAVTISLDRELVEARRKALEEAVAPPPEPAAEANGGAGKTTAQVEPPGGQAPQTPAAPGGDPAPAADPKVIERDAWLAVVQSGTSGLGADLFDPEAAFSSPEPVVSADVASGRIRVRFQLALKRQASEWELKKALAFPEKSGLANPSVELVGASAPPLPQDTSPANELTLVCGVPKRDATGALRTDMTQFIRDQLQDLRNSGALDFTEPFPRFTKVGPTVATEMAANALMAMLYAMVAIFFYIWLRFQFRAAFGAGAVIALAHDVLIALGALAIADHFGILNGQIDLVIVAALLTIVGYSLNDTIVVFDRIRENLHSGSRAIEEVINASINQTLSRTVITSLTTLLVVVALLAWGGDVIRGFAFALFIGILVGTYSSIFIASPILVEFAHAYAARQKRKREVNGEQ